MRNILMTIIAASVGVPTAWAENPPQAARQPLDTLYFAFDSSRLDPAERPRLERAEAWLDAHPDEYLVIAAHTDPIGTDAYNAGLATRRGENVRTKLLAMGADPARLVVTIYGESQLVSSNNAENRRVELRGTSETLDEIVTRTFKEGMAVVWGYEPSPQVVARRDLGMPRA